MKDTILNNFSLEKIAWILKKRIIYAILIAIISAAAAGYLSYRFGHTEYTAKISLYVFGSSSYSDSSYSVSSSDFSMAKTLVPSYMLVLKSDTVLSEIIEKFSINSTVEALRDKISASEVENTAVFYVYVFDSDPYMAMNVANAIADVASSAIAGVVKTGGVQVLDHASLPVVPSSESDPILYAIIAGAVGLVVSLLIFITAGLMDTTIRSKKELLRIFDIPILGDVPLIKDPSRKVKAQKILDIESPFAIRESYNAIRTNLLFTGAGDQCPVYAVTSAEQSDGKTLNCINIAISYALMGKKTLIIDADLRNPSVHPHFELTNDKIGLSQYLAGITTKVNVVDTKIKDLMFLSAGAIPPNPAELLGMERFSSLIDILKKQFECIFIDLSPAGTVSDAMLISDKVTDYIIVVRSNVSKLVTEKRLIEAFERIDARIGGFIFNGVNPKAHEYSAKYYTYGSK